MTVALLVAALVLAAALGALLVLTARDLRSTTAEAAAAAAALDATRRQLAWAEAVQRDASDQFNALHTVWTAHLAICRRCGIPLPADEDTDP